MMARKSKSQKELDAIKARLAAVEELPDQMRQEWSYSAADDLEAMLGDYKAIIDELVAEGRWQ